MSQQLVKKGTNGKHENVMPRSWIEAIKDKYTGQSLLEILQGFNMYFLSYTGGKEDTRLQVPMNLRKRGLWIVYENYDDEVIVEWYDKKSIEDEIWKLDSSWKRVPLTSDVKFKIENGSLYVSYNNGKSWEELGVLSDISTTSNIVPDEEDITAIESEDIKILKFRDRDITKGKGYIILRTDKPIAEQITQDNTIYEVRYDFDLNEETLEIPVDCVLDFKGGSFKNGTINFNYCSIRADYKIFDNITFGTRPNGSVNVVWFGAKGDRETDNTDIFRKAFGLGMPVYIPSAYKFYIIKETITIKNNVKCEGRILFEAADTSIKYPVFLVEGGDFHSKASSTLVIDGLDVTQSNPNWTGIGIKIERHSTHLINSFFYALYYGIDINSYCIKVNNCTVRSCTSNINIAALNGNNQCNDIAITNCVIGQGRWLAVDIGGEKPSSLDGWNGWNILLQGCAFDEASVRIDHSYNVAIKDCYFERASATDIGIIINEDTSKYTSHSVKIDNCSFINFQYAIDSRVHCDNLSVTNCTFKSIKRCAILCILGTRYQKITILNNKFKDSVKGFHYGIEHWSGNFNDYNFDGLTYDGWYMTNGCQDVPAHGKCNFITKTYKSYSVLDQTYNGLGHVKSTEPLGNTYISPLVNVSASYTKGADALNNTLTISSDTDYFRFNVWDRIFVNDSNGVSHQMFVKSSLRIKNGNILTVVDLSNSLMESCEECTVSQVSATFDIEWTFRDAPTTKLLAKGTIAKIANSTSYYKYDGTTWIKYNEDGTRADLVKTLSNSMSNAEILNTAYRNNVCVVDVIDLQGKTLTMLDGGTLEFKQGGKLINGQLNPHNTKLLPNCCNLNDYLDRAPSGTFRKGQIVYDEDLGKLKMSNGSIWVNLDGTPLQ